MAGAFHGWFEESLQQSPAMDQEDQRHRRRLGQIQQSQSLVRWGFGEADVL